MQPNLLIVFIWSILYSSALQPPIVSPAPAFFSSMNDNNPYHTISEIPLPAGYSRFALGPR